MKKIEPLNPSVTDKAALKATMETDGWKFFMKLVEWHIDTNQFVLQSTEGDHRYHQGKLHSLFLLKHSIDQVLQEPKFAEENESLYAFYRGKASSTLDY